MDHLLPHELVVGALSRTRSFDDVTARGGATWMSMRTMATHRSMIGCLSRRQFAEKGEEHREGLGDGAVVSLGPPAEPQRERLELRRAAQDAQPRIVRVIDEHARQG